MNKQKWIAMLLAGGKGTRLNQLTHTLVKPAVPFGGKYRIIDFTLSNCANSGVDTVGVLTQYKPHFLHSYLGNGSHWDLHNKNRGLTILPPYQSEQGVTWYDGTSHAVFQNIDFIDEHEPEHVLILSGDHIYKMNYERMLEHHIKKDADATISFVEVPWGEASRFGILKINEMTYQIKEFEEKPIKPSSNLASMGIYIFKWPLLKQYLIQEEQKKFTSRDFGKNILPSMLSDGRKLYGYYFDQYWKDVGTVKSYWEANMDLLDHRKNLFLQNPEWKIYTVENNEPPLYLDQDAYIHRSLVNEGCEIYGVIDNSVIFNGVKIGKGSTIRNSIILPHVIIGENVLIENAVIGSNSFIQRNVTIKSDTINDIAVIGNHEKVEKDLFLKKEISHII